MADLDLEALEELMKQEEKAKQAQERGDDRSDRSSRQRKRSRTRSRSKKKKSHKHKHSKDRHKHKKRRHSGSKSAEASDEESKKKAIEEEEVIDPIKKQQEALKKQIEEAKRQAEEAQRDDCTVLVNRLPLHANEKDIYTFFSKEKAVGKIRDVRLIRDQRSGKSKGISYVEFYTPESVLLAMALSGSQIQGQTIMIQASQAEKNRAAAASKFKKDLDKFGPASSKPQKKSEDNNQVYVGGLVDVLNQVNESDIRQWFNPFGEIENIELPKDHITGRNKGHAIIEFKRHKDAKTAVKEMNGFEINGKKLKVSIVTDQVTRQLGSKADYDLEDDSANQYIHSAQSRALLMQKLSRESNKQDSGQAISSQNFNNQPQVLHQYVQAQPSNCLLLNNMFDPEAIDLKKDPASYIDIKEQVEEVCGELGKVEKVWVEQNSPGNVWVKFNKNDIQGSQRAQVTLNQRYFDSRLITANFVPENVFNSKVKER